MTTFKDWYEYNIRYKGEMLLVYFHRDRIYPIFEHSARYPYAGMYIAHPPKELVDAVILWARSNFYADMTLQEFLDGLFP